MKMRKNYTLVDVDEGRYVFVCKICGEAVENTKLHDACHVKEGF